MSNVSVTLSAKQKDKIVFLRVIFFMLYVMSLFKNLFSLNIAPAKVLMQFITCDPTPDTILICSGQALNRSFIVFCFSFSLYWIGFWTLNIQPHTCHELELKKF